jgi:hypothetical protein
MAGSAAEGVGGGVGVGYHQAVAVEHRSGNISRLTGGTVRKIVARGAVENRMEIPPDAGATGRKAWELARVEVV